MSNSVSAEIGVLPSPSFACRLAAMESRGFMSFASPVWLLLLPALALFAWWRKELALWRPLRAAALLLIVALLARPQARLQQEGLDLWVLLDRSESTEDRIDRGLPEWEKLMNGAKRSRGDELHLVDFAMDAVPQEENGGGAFTGNRRLTRTGLAIDSLIALRNPDKATRFLLFTDGYSTESLSGISERLIKENIPLDVRLLGEPPGSDFRLRRLRMPVRAQTGEPFLIEAEVSGPRDGEIPLTILRNGVSILETKAVITKGRGVARFTDRIGGSGSYHYEARIAPAEDSHPGNNRYDSWIEITGGPRLLLVSGYLNDPVADVLKRQFNVDVVTDPKTLHAGMLSGCRGVILNNVPAWEMPSAFLAGLDFYVNAQGGGLLMAGGKRSFGAGGYFRSSIDELLPVSMELKKDQRKLVAAISIVLDRSGSMAAGVAGGKTKMDLANEGSAKAMEFMGYQDNVAVFAVDSEAHEMVPMQTISDESNKSDLMDQTRRITSGGGGIFVYNGLKAGWKALRSTSVGTRHIILFADAADAEQTGDGPGADYKSLLEEVTLEGATVSVIALGTESDSDAGFLKDVAARGKGRIFFTDRPEDLPNVFTAETLAVTRNAFLSDPTSTLVSGQWQEISGKSLDWISPVDGYNLSYKRDWASQALVTKDEYTAPLVAWGLRGAGRTAAVCFPLAGEFSSTTRAWPGYGDFLQTMGRWLMGEDVPPDIGLRWDLAGSSLSIDLIYAGDWEKTFAQSPPRILLASGDRADNRREGTWERMEPGHYRANVDLTEGEVVRGAIQVGKYSLPFGPLTVGTNTEWAFDPGRVEELRQVSAQTSGREIGDLEKVWLSPPLKELTDLRRWILPLALLLILADALITRMGWRLPKLALSRKPKAKKAPKPSAVPVPALAAAAPQAAEELPPAPPTASEDAASRRRARYARARKR